MRGSSVAKWLAVFSFVLTSPVWSQNANPDVKKLGGFEELKVNPVKLAELRVTFDVSEVPEQKEWAEKAQKLVEDWHPKIEEILKTEGYTAPREVKLVFKKDMMGVAFASGKTITISGEWIKKRPDDFGMVAHELTHVIQSYRGAPRNAGWVVEGIADYVRHYAYEPDVKMRKIDVKKAKYTDAYQTAAQFLRWIEKKYDKDFVLKLNRALREREYNVAMFEKSTGKNVDDLWVEFISTLTKKD
jgi:hypothetical protein